MIPMAVGNGDGYGLPTCSNWCDDDDDVMCNELTLCVCRGN